MTITRIIYHAANESMGDTNPYDCNAYRAWARSQIMATYPSAVVEVTSMGQGSYSAESDMDYPFNESEVENAKEYLCTLWTDCPWTGEYFDHIK